jgi:hypothetical protein
MRANRAFSLCLSLFRRLLGDLKVAVEFLEVADHALFRVHQEQLVELRVLRRKSPMPSLTSGRFASHPEQPGRTAEAAASRRRRRPR